MGSIFDKFHDIDTDDSTNQEVSDKVKKILDDVFDKKYAPENIDLLSRYDSPINLFETRVKSELENKVVGECLRISQKFGFYIDQEKLFRALTHDRTRYQEAYERGYREGYNKGLLDGIQIAIETTP